MTGPAAEGRILQLDGGNGAAIVSGKGWRIILAGEVPAGVSDQQLNHMMQQVGVPLGLVATVRVITGEVLESAPEGVKG